MMKFNIPMAIVGFALWFSFGFQAIVNSGTINSVIGFFLAAIGALPLAFAMTYAFGKLMSSTSTEMNKSWASWGIAMAILIGVGILNIVLLLTRIFLQNKL